jgi:hypothetical protein
MSYCNRLRQHLEEVRACHGAEVGNGFVRVVLPFALGCHDAPQLTARTLAGTDLGREAVMRRIGETSFVPQLFGMRWRGAETAGSGRSL